MNFAVLASGNGTNLQAIIKAIKAKQIKASLKVVLSDKSGAFALERARKAGVPCVVNLAPEQYLTREAFDQAMLDVLKKEEIDFVVLAGYMRILSPLFIEAYRHKILNIHPSLLPAFKGSHAIKDAFQFGVKVTGVTVHFVDEQVDHGVIIAQSAVEIGPNDTFDMLVEKVHEAEHKLYPYAINLFIRGKIKAPVVKAVPPVTGQHR
ncbi:MAG: phosphoribosylglycinamide formyltransferase [Candidatus Omnitrophica bacterium]|nr:phosphoribosylglycinamide formyltransferase [Candidatus Omnitrophota bacterium]